MNINFLRRNNLHSDIFLRIQLQTFAKKILFLSARQLDMNNNNETHYNISSKKYKNRTIKKLY